MIHELDEINQRISNNLMAEDFDTWEQFAAHLGKHYKKRFIGKGKFARVYAIRNKNIAGLLLSYPKEFVIRIAGAGKHKDEQDYTRFVEIARKKHTPTGLWPLIIDHKEFKNEGITVTVIERVKKLTFLEGYIEYRLGQMASYYEEFGAKGPPKNIGTKGSKYEYQKWGDYDDFEDSIDEVTKAGFNLNALYEMFETLYDGPNAFMSFDMHAGNMGKRKNGSMVIFDP